MRKLSEYISETDAKTEWKKQYLESCLALSNNDLWELYQEVGCIVKRKDLKQTRCLQY